METIYCLSGLGADQRIFQKLDIPGYQLAPIHWADYDKHDDLPCYAQKMAVQIPDDNPIILGVSFGGMLASEIAKIRKVKKVILVSSAKDSTELPPVGGFVNFIVHHGLLPVGITKLPSRQTYRRFGAQTDEEQHLLISILKATDNGFLKWATKAMIDWRSMHHENNLLHIHGTADRIITPKHVKPDYWIEGGTHFMVYHNAAEISAIIAKHLA